MKSFPDHRTLGPPLIVLFGVCCLWEAASRGFRLPAFLLPPPTQVARAAWETRCQLASAFRVTAQAAVCGLALSTAVGTAIAVVFSQSAFVRRGFYPYAIFLQTVPIVAIAPLVIIWFGRGFASVALISFMISVFPVITNTTAGLTLVDRNLIALFTLHRASWWMVLTRLRLPNSVPYLLTGIRIASGIAVIGAIVGEFFVGLTEESPGLGYLIRQKSKLLRTDELFAAVIGSTILGVAIFATISALESFILRRWYDHDGEH